MAYTYKRCGVVKLSELMPAEDRQALHNLILSKLSAAEVAKELRRSGWPLGYQVVVRHRQGLCSCV